MLSSLFEEKDFYAVKNFAKFIKTKNEKEVLKDLLENAEFNKEELNEKTLKDIEKTRMEFLKGKSFSSEQIKSELGI